MPRQPSTADIASHDIGDHRGSEGTEYSRTDAIEDLNADQPEAVIGEGGENRTDREDREPDEKQRLQSQLSAVRPTGGAIGSMTA